MAIQSISNFWDSRTAAQKVGAVVVLSAVALALVSVALAYGGVNSFSKGLNDVFQSKYTPARFLFNFASMS